MDEIPDIMINHMTCLYIHLGQYIVYIIKCVLRFINNFNHYRFVKARLVVHKLGL